MAEGPWPLVTCEHAANHVPAAYRALFRDDPAVLQTHRAWDIGAAGLAVALAETLNAPLYRGAVTRLLVDLNRSPDHPGLLSPYSRRLPRDLRERLVEDWYRPYREQVTREVAAAIQGGRAVFHLSVHSFTPVLDGRTRTTDLGLLYDPGRGAEAAMARTWRGLLRQHTGLRVRRNYPYRGIADGFVTWLRRRFPTDRYAGVELEVNQGLARNGQLPGDLIRAIGKTLDVLLNPAA